MLNSKAVKVLSPKERILVLAGVCLALVALMSALWALSSSERSVGWVGELSSTLAIASFIAFFAIRHRTHQL